MSSTYGLCLTFLFSVISGEYAGDPGEYAGEPGEYAGDAAEYPGDAASMPVMRRVCR